MAKLPAPGQATPAHPPRPTPPSPPRPAPGTKAARQSRIVAILSREQVHSQEQLAALLTQYAAMHVAQATLSRDLDELGVVRLRAADGTLVYALPGDPGGTGSRPGTGLDPQIFPERSVLSPGHSVPAASAGLYGQMFDLLKTAPTYNTATPITTGNGPLQDSSGALGCGSYAGTPVQQAMCLMRGMDATRNLLPPLHNLPPALAKRVGQTTELPSRTSII